MAEVLKSAKIFLHGVELTGQMNQVGLEYGAESLDETVFGMDTRVRKGGLKFARATGRGFYSVGATAAADPALVDGVGNNAQVMTVFPRTAAGTITEGSTSTGSGYAFQVTQARVAFGGQVGELLPFEFAVDGRGVQS